MSRGLRVGMAWGERADGCGAAGARLHRLRGRGRGVEVTGGAEDWWRPGARYWEPERQVWGCCEGGRREEKGGCRVL
eukprot:1603147-Rhodomonas_salina.2